MRPLSLSFQRSLSVGTSDRALYTVRRDLAQLQEQSATGLRVNRPSDDPGAFEQARHWEAHGDRLTTHQRTVGAARLWVDTTDQALGELTELVVSAYEAGLKGLNDTNGEDERKALATTVESLLEQTVDRLNTQTGGEYVFGGNRTDERPFADDGTATGDLSGRRVRRIGPDADLAVNVTGDRVNVYADGGDGPAQTVTGALQALADALRSGEGLEDAVGEVEQARDHLIAVAGEYGETGRRLSTAEVQLADAALLAERRRSELEDADLFEVTAGIQRAQVQLQATLQTLATVEQRSLLDYLR